MDKNTIQTIICDVTASPVLKAERLFNAHLHELNITALRQGDSLIPDLSQWYMATVAPFDGEKFWISKFGIDCMCTALLNICNGISSEPAKVDVLPVEENDAPKPEAPKKPKDNGGKIRHEKFNHVKFFVEKDMPVLLYGPAGTGKSELCSQVAEALGLQFYFSNSVSQEYKIAGFVDAHGKYQETEFYRAFTQGGLFFLDELDASAPDVLVLLNSALSGERMFDFPGKGLTRAHKDFRVIAAANTLCTGADDTYTGRYQLDAASTNRFAKIAIDYCEDIEIKICGGDQEFVNFVHDLRRSMKECGINIPVTYRNISMFKETAEGLSEKDAMMYTIVSGLDGDNVLMLANNMDSANKYTKLLKKCGRELAA